MVGNVKKWHDEPVELKAGSFTLRAYKEQTLGNTFAVRFEWSEENVWFAEILDAAGELVFAAVSRSFSVIAQRSPRVPRQIVTAG